jgi:hypothetical protein
MRSSAAARPSTVLIARLSPAKETPSTGSPRHSPLPTKLQPRLRRRFQISLVLEPKVTVTTSGMRSWSMVVPPRPAQISAKRVAAEECAGSGSARRARRFHAGRARIRSSGFAVLRSISAR